MEFYAWDVVKFLLYLVWWSELEQCESTVRRSDIVGQMYIYIIMYNRSDGFKQTRLDNFFSSKLKRNNSTKKKPKTSCPIKYFIER